MIGPSTVSIEFPTKPLGEVVEFLDHLRKPITASDREPGPIPYYGANGQQDSVAGWIFDEPLVLLAEDGGHFDTPDRGIAYRIDGKSWVNNHAHVLRTVGDLDTRWLARALENYDVRQFLTGSTRAKLTKSGASRIPIPLPPIEEQRRIAAVLDAADALRAKRHQALAKLNTLTQAIFVYMFGDPRFSNGLNGFAVVADLVKNEDSIRVPVKSTDRDTMTGDYPYYGASGVIDYVDDYLFQGRRLLVAEDGANLLARSSPIAFIAEGEYWVNNHAHVLADNGRANLVYLCEALQMLDLSPYVTGSAQPKLNRKRLDSIRVPDPDRDLQDEFERRASDVHCLARRWREQADRFDTLFASLQQSAFRGEL